MQILMKKLLGFIMPFLATGLLMQTTSCEKKNAAPTTNTKTALLSAGGAGIAAVASGNKIFFAGGTDNSGFSTRTVDIYDAPSNAWTTAQLSEARLDFAGAAAGKKFFLREDTVLPKQ